MREDATRYRAVWNGGVLAESDRAVVVEGNRYFPPESVNWDHLEASDTNTVCPWKGTASYYTAQVDGRAKRDAAWTYPEPKRAARKIQGYVAFWRGVRVEPVDASGGQTRAKAWDRRPP